MTLITYRVNGCDNLELVTNEKVFVPTGTSELIIDAIVKSGASGGKVLDLGCGIGLVGIALRSLGFATDPVFASDLSEEAVELTSENYKRVDFELIAKCGSLFEPWDNEKFDCIVDDISGVATSVAAVSPWFQNVPCESGEDGTALVKRVIEQAPYYLNPGGKLFFPVLSLSRGSSLVNTAKRCFSSVTKVSSKTWPLPQSMDPYRGLLKELAEENIITIQEKFGLVLWTTDIYMAHS